MYPTEFLASQVERLGSPIANCVKRFRGRGDETSLYIGAGFAGCCGAHAMYGMDAIVHDGTERGKQEFLTAFLRNEPARYTQYMIVTDAQLKVAHKNSAIMMFKELGAREVDNTPNHNQAPNHMLLYVWAPIENKDLLRKYVSFNQLCENVDPLWFVEASNEEQKAISQRYLAEATARNRAASLAYQIRVNRQVAEQRRSLEGIITYNPEWLKALGWEPKSIDELAAK